RRHTRWPRDWSSDVCSSDLPVGRRILDRGEHVLLDEESRAGDQAQLAQSPQLGGLLEKRDRVGAGHEGVDAVDLVGLDGLDEWRSEERRVGKECRSEWRIEN